MVELVDDAIVVLVVGRVVVVVAVVAGPGGRGSVRTPREEAAGDDHDVGVEGALDQLEAGAGLEVARHQVGLGLVPGRVAHEGLGDVEALGLAGAGGTEPGGRQRRAGVARRGR